MSKILPTVGRSLWLTVVNPGSSGLAVIPGQPLCAQIAAVHSNDNIAIGFLDATGKHHDMASVPLMQDGEPTPGGEFYCTWIPFQVGQARAVASAEAPAADTHANADAGQPTTGGLTPKDPSLNAAPAADKPTTGGLTPKNDKLPAPAATAAKKVAAVVPAKPVPKPVAKTVVKRGR